MQTIVFKATVYQLFPHHSSFHLFIITFHTEVYGFKKYMVLWKHVSPYFCRS